jgi:hypothetical protein
MATGVAEQPGTAPTIEAPKQKRVCHTLAKPHGKNKVWCYGYGEERESFCSDCNHLTETVCEESSHQGTQATQAIQPFYSTGTDYVKSLFGVSETFAEDLPQDPVREIHALSNEVLFPIGEKCLREVCDDIIILSEIRSRFQGHSNILGYVNWKDFVAKNSKYSIRTVQKRLNEVNGKDEKKANKNPGNKYTRPSPYTALAPTAPTPATISAVGLKRIATAQQARVKDKPVKKSIFDKKVPKLTFGFLPRTMDIDKSKLKYEVWTPTLRFQCHGKNMDDVRRLAKTFGGDARRMEYSAAPYWQVDGYNTSIARTSKKELEYAATRTAGVVKDVELLLKGFQGMKSVAGISGLGKDLQVTTKKLQKVITVLKSADFKISVPTLEN